MTAFNLLILCNSPGIVSLSEQAFAFDFMTLNTNRLRISVILPTYNRPSELNKCIESILVQTLPPDEIIVIDDGCLSEPPLKQHIDKLGISYIYFKKNEPGLTKSRNTGVELSTGDIIFFFDDDVVLSPDYIERVMEFYQDDTLGIIGGVGGVITNIKPLTAGRRLRRYFNILFLMSGFKEGKVLSSGFTSDYGDKGIPLNKSQEVDFLPGCAMSFRKEIFREFSFDAYKYLKYGLGEDKDFSYRVSRKYKLIIAAKARLQHFESPTMRPNKKAMGRMAISSRYLFFKKNINKRWWNWILFYYALFGYVAIRFVSLIVRPSKEKVERLKGNFQALKDIYQGELVVRL